jgi:hypothetical protein
VLAVAEHVLDAGAMPVPELDLRGFARCGHITIGQDEGIGVDRVRVGQFGDRQGTLVGVKGCGGVGIGDRPRPA